MGKLSLFQSFQIYYEITAFPDQDQETNLTGHDSKIMRKCVISLNRVGFQPSQTVLVLHMLKSSFPCVDTLVWFEKCLCCKILLICKAPHLFTSMLALYSFLLLFLCPPLPASLPPCLICHFFPPPFPSCVNFNNQ